MTPNEFKEKLKIIYEANAASLAGNGLLKTIRKKAFDAFYSASFPTTKNEALHMWSAGTPLISDRVAANTFYYYIQSAGKTELYKSTDGGATFTKINTTLEANYAMKLKAVPGKQGHLFFYARSNGNLMHSTDAGTTFTAVSNVTSVKGIGFGKAIAPSTEPTVYLVGSINGIPGLYFSTNYCNTWNASPSSKLPI